MKAKSKYGMKLQKKDVENRNQGRRRKTRINRLQRTREKMQVRKKRKHAGVKSPTETDKLTARKKVP